MNKSSSLLLHLHLHLHLLHFFDNEQIFIFQKKKKKEENFQKRPWDQGHWARTSQVALKKKKKKIINQNFQFLEKIQDFQILSKKKIKIFSSLKKFQISKFFKKKKKILQSIFFQKFKISKFFKKKSSIKFFQFLETIQDF